MATHQDFVEYVVKALVNHPDDVKCERTVDEMGVLITLDVHAEDMGMVIGREGMTAKALRTLLRVIGARNNARVNLKINEPEGSTRGRREFAPAAPTTEPVAVESVAPTTPSSASAMGMSEPAPTQSAPRTFEDVMNDIKI